mmetsp:Transcript_22623/g.42225  ORF Transcript_22623/g.42225 Transcript_22623/m.42225 type:complete len:125 (+) Transcript_22623:142-516(+)
MSRPQQQRGGTYTKYGATDYNGSEVSAFQRKLNETHLLAKANENIAGDVLDEMQQQRVTLDQAHDDLTSMQRISTSAKNMIQAIQNKSNRKEITLKAVIIGLFILDAVLIGIVIKNGGSLFSHQ